MYVGNWVISLAVVENRLQIHGPRSPLRASSHVPGISPSLALIQSHPIPFPLILSSILSLDLHKGCGFLVFVRFLVMLMRFSGEISYRNEEERESERASLVPPPDLVVGYALTSKKVKSFLQPKLEGLAR